MKEALKELARRETFFPAVVGLFTNPFYLARRGLAVAIERYSAHLSGRLLDVGCGTQPYKHLFSVSQYVGLDVDNEHSRKLGIADFFYDGNTFPLENGAFDSVLCNQVLEHVFNPDVFLKEIRRVLKPQGKLLITVPFVWDEHEQPFDYARYSSFGLRWLLEKNGFSVLNLEKIGNDFGILFQLTNTYLYKIVQRYPKPLRLVVTVSVMAMINMLGMITAGLLPKNSDLYLDQIVLAERNT